MVLPAEEPLGASEGARSAYVLSGAVASTLVYLSFEVFAGVDYTTPSSGFPQPLLTTLLYRMAVVRAPRRSSGPRRPRGFGPRWAAAGRAGARRTVRPR